MVINNFTIYNYLKIKPRKMNPFLMLSHIFLYFNDLGISLYKKGENLLACAQHYLYLQH